MLRQVNPARIGRKKDGGFTLIELMIVIAVIGILAVVLVPKIGNLKTSAKVSGVETNFRSVTTAIFGLKNLTPSNVQNNTLAGNKVYDQLNTIFASSGTNALNNPFTNTSTITYTDGGAAPVASGNALIINIGDTTTTGDTITSSVNRAGSILVDPYVDSNGVITVHVYGYDQNGVTTIDQLIQP